MSDVDIQIQKIGKKKDYDTRSTEERPPEDTCSNEQNEISTKYRKMTALNWFNDEPSKADFDQTATNKDASNRQNLVSLMNQGNEMKLFSPDDSQIFNSNEIDPSKDKAEDSFSFDIKT